MKKPAVVLFLFAVLAISLYAQETVKTAHFEIAVEHNASAAADLLATELELRFGVYNRLFRFDPALLGSPLRARVFSDQAGYDAYISARLGESKPGAVYLHYNHAERRELVVLHGSDKESPILPHQAFVQFLRAFIPNPPSWIREGFAIYFSTLTFDPAREQLGYEENLAWLEMVKTAGRYGPTLQAVIHSDLNGTPLPDYQVFSWAAVSFFLNQQSQAGGTQGLTSSGTNNGQDNYFRTLTDCFMLLSPSAGTEENALAVQKRISLWHDSETLEKDYRAYLEARKTFAGLIEEGRSAHASGDPIGAELSFLGAMNQKPAHYAPWYYLGLLYYEEKNYSLAEAYYIRSLEYGADEALVSYALGLNALAASRSDDAADWLTKAAAADPARYKTRVDELLLKLE
jgi:tetratricopeptide (TPR) repeat protein